MGEQAGSALLAMGRQMVIEAGSDPVFPSGVGVVVGF